MRSIENPRANALLEAGSFLSSQAEDGTFDYPFELEINEEGQVSEIRNTTTNSTANTYSLNNSILKGDTRIFVPNWWFRNQNTQSDVIVFKVQENDNNISGEVHLVSSEMMKDVYESDNEQTLEALNYAPKGVKAIFEIAASGIQVSTTVQPENIIYAVTVDGETQLRTTAQSEDETNMNIRDEIRDEDSGVLLQELSVI